MAINLRDYADNRFQAQFIISRYEYERNKTLDEIL